MALATPWVRLAGLLTLAAAAAATDAQARGALLVGNKSANTVWWLALEDGRRLHEAGTGPGPHEIVVSPDGRTAAVSEYGHDRPGNTVGVYAAHDGRLLHRVERGGHTRPHGMRFAADGGLLVTIERSQALLRVDPAGIERVYEVGPGLGHMVALSADDRYAYVSKLTAGSVARVDLASGEVLERPAGKGAEGIAVAPDGTVWVSNRSADTVTVHDPDTLEVLATLDSPGFPIRVAFTADGAHAVVTNARTATLAVFSTRDRTPVATVPLVEEGARFRDTMLGRDALPIGAIADPDGGRVYVAVSGANQIAVVDTASWTVVERWSTGDEPDALAIVRDLPEAP